MTHLESLKKKKAKLEAALSKVNQEIQDDLRTSLVYCDNKKCGNCEQIGHVTYVQSHWYTPPRGCTEGDYWNEGEGGWDCPKCGKVVRLYQKPEIAALRHLFKDERKTYRDYL